MAPESALETFVTESRDLLGDMEDALLGIARGDDRPDRLNAIFRAAHTIKGSAGLFGLSVIVDFTHGVESLLDLLRGEAIELDPEITGLLIACCDHMLGLIDQVDPRTAGHGAPASERGDALAAQLHELIARAAPAPGARAPSDAVAEPDPNQDRVASNNWHISVRLSPGALRDGMDPISFIRYLGTLGEIVSIQTLDDALPPAPGMDPETCYLGYEIGFRSQADANRIEGVFEFVRDGSLIRVLSPRCPIADYARLIRALPEGAARLGEILVHLGSLTPAELHRALDIGSPSESEETSRLPAVTAPTEQLPALRAEEGDVAGRHEARHGRHRKSGSVRMDAGKLDHLIAQIGELVIAGAGAALDARASGNGALIESVAKLDRLIEEVRDTALRLRMVRIDSTFNRFQRVVHDVSRELGKTIHLAATGGDTELDKAIVEKIGDPLLHLVRNAIDHGIEPASVRAALGKPEAGLLRLDAYHDSGSIVIEVADDGAGLDRDRILARAIDRGLVQPGVNLDDRDIHHFIFEPGFSTAETITRLSGRGVGMDVVRRNITELRGTIEVDSRRGLGTTFRLRMPLTLAIVDGFLVEAAGARYVVPLDMVLECVELTATTCAGSADRDYIDLRGEVLPFIRLRDAFGLEGRAPPRQNVVVVHNGGSKAGLVVDRLLGEFQTVVKPLGRIFDHARGVGGSTILSNGAVALILDIHGLVQQATSAEGRTAKCAGMRCR